ncbi:helix-turn-helix domain-containing protein [Streptomyces sp. NPDC058052]|uniref:helix-turn-helix domain-containing protein n=1 Tax=Streptomyces sp. NPDC058052 TaxID=3346316 RepID=UPI0036E4CE9C
MGRRENCIAPCGKALGALVAWLRAMRRRAGVSYEELARRTAARPLPDGTVARCSADTLARAAAGQRVPRLRTVLAYAVACGAAADPREGERLWKRARYEETLPLREREGHAQHITYIRDFADLRIALIDLYRKDGSRPYEELERDSDGVLAHATVSRVINGSTGRPTREFVMAFARTCGVRGKALEDWGQAWDRAEARRIGPRPKARKPAVPAKTRLVARTRLMGSYAVHTTVRPASDADVFTYLDRVRLPDGEETWVANSWSTKSAGLYAVKLERAEREAMLSPRQLDAARSLDRTRCRAE